MNRKLITLLAASAALLASAAPVSLTQAQAVARDFVSRPGMRHAPGGGTLTLAHEAKAASGLTDFYVFNADGGGFIVVSGDDMALPVLGYSDAGAFDADKLPDNVRWWLGEYQREMEWLRQNPQVTPRQPITLTTSVSPLLTTQWSQGQPYNNYCPASDYGNADDNAYYGGRAVTGCVATATAQIMKYYNWPPTGTGSHSYTCDVEGGSTQTLSANFGQTTYDWTNMASRYGLDDQNNVYAATLTGSWKLATDVQKNSVATLMSHVGIAADMGYGNSSGAYSEDMPYALSNYFRYQSLGFYKRSQYESNWEVYLRRDLDAGRPIYYSGSGDGGGHAFVFDGYNTDGYFHVNWGWNGNYDGYFASTALNPDGLGEGGGTGAYNTNQGAIIGLAPAKLLLNTNIAPTSTTMPMNNVTATAKVTANGAAYSGTVRAYILDADNNTYTYVDVDVSLSANQTKTINFTMSFNGTAGNTYYLRLSDPNAPGYYWDDAVAFTEGGDSGVSSGTVQVGTTNSSGRSESIPICNWWMGTYQGNEVIYYADELGLQSGDKITDLSYYCQSAQSTPAGGTFNVRMANTTATQLTEGSLLLSTSNAVNGNVQIGTYSGGQWITFHLSNPLVYTGGNIVIDIRNSVIGSQRGWIYFSGFEDANHTKRSVSWDKASSESGSGGTPGGWCPTTRFTYTRESTNVPVTSVTVSPTSATLAVGATKQLTATIAPSNATNKAVTWTSSNTSVATVSSTGLVTAKAAGTATITATAQDGSGKKGTCTVTVTNPTVLVTSVTVSPSSATLNVGNTKQLTATIAPSNATNKAVTWSSSNTSVATVSSSGLVTAKAAGTATITATAQDGSGKKGTCTVTVTNASSTLPKAEAPELTITPSMAGQVITLPITLTMPSGGDFTQIELHFTFPEGLRPIADDDDLYGYEGDDIPLKGRVPVVSFSDNMDDDSNWPDKYTAVGANITQTPVTTNPCHVYTLNVTADNNFTAGDRPMLIYIKYTDSSNNSYTVGTKTSKVVLTTVHFSAGYNNGGTVSAPDLTVTPNDVGQEFAIPITVDFPSDASFWVIQTDLTFPEGLRPVRGEATSVFPSWTFQNNFDSNEFGDKWPNYTIVGTNNPIQGNVAMSGPKHVYTVYVTPIDGFNTGDRDMMAHVKYVNSNSTSWEIGTSDQFVSMCTVHFEGPMLDVNGDGRVDTDDVNAVINLILERTTAFATTADVNSDGEVNIFDVNAIIDYILAH